MERRIIEVNGTMKSKSSLTCGECRTLLPGYIGRELSREARARVASHIDTCDTCYGVYLQQRAVTGELRQLLPAIGQAETPRLESIWSAVQTGLSQPRVSPLQKDPTRFGIAALIIAAAVLLPWLINQQRLVLSLPLPPTPVALAVLSQETEAVITSATAEGNTVSVNTEYVSMAATPPAQPNYSPVIQIGATDAP